MRLELSSTENCVSFHFLIEEHDEAVVANSKMDNTTFTFAGPVGWSIDECHPDHIALAAILCAYPWARDVLHLPFEVSERFSESFAGLRLKVEPCSAKIKPYVSGDNSKPGLAFSGGVDSTAALSVMPKSTIPIFMNRPQKMLTRTLYDKDAALRACDILDTIGYNVQVLDCDLEYLRSPIGFPTDLANAVPLILTATWFDIDSIAFGTVLESLYSVGRKEFKEYSKTSHYKVWWKPFAGAGIDLNFPVGGVSEVGTELICAKSKIGFIAQSCIRGTWENPCMNCWKCFRKEMIKSGLNLKEYSLPVMKKMLAARDVKKQIKLIPIKHENVLLFSAQRLRDKELPPSIASRLDYKEDLSALMKWYSPSRDFIYPSHLEATERNLIMLLGVMDQKDLAMIEGWSMKEWLESLERIQEDKRTESTN
jgi:hypothetical protein